MANLSSNLYMRFFQKDPPQEFIEKRRKLSVLSHSTDSQSSDLNEKFNKLEITPEQKFSDNLTLSNGSQVWFQIISLYSRAQPHRLTLSTFRSPSRRANAFHTTYLPLSGKIQATSIWTLWSLSC